MRTLALQSREGSDMATPNATLRARPYAGPTDLSALLALWPACRPAGWATDFPSPTDLIELLAAPEVAARTQVWEDAAGQVAAYALVDSYNNNAIVSPSSRLYVEPQAVFAQHQHGAHHQVYDARSALAVLRAIAHGRQRWSDIAAAVGVTTSSLSRVMEALIGDLGLVERVLPVTESHPTRTYYTQYHLTDNFFRFWFRFIEPNQGHIEFGDVERITDLILARLPDYMGLPFEAMCRDWVRMASAAGALAQRVGRVGTWWNPDHQLDIVGLDEEGRAAILGEAKWHTQPFDYQELERYLGHVRALGSLPQPNVLHLLFARAGFADDVRRWADVHHARLLTPADMLARFQA